MKFSPPLFKICTGLAIIMFTINQGMQPGANLDNSDSFEDNRTKIEIKANRGNTNAENSCFLNSVIQALYHLEPFRFTFEPELIESVQSERLNQDIIDDNDYYADQENTIKLKNVTDPVIEYSKGSVPKALIQHITTMAGSNPDEGDPIDPSTFRQKFSFYSSATMEFCDGQHDAAEFYTLLIDQLWQQIVPMEKARKVFLKLFNTELDDLIYNSNKREIEDLWDTIADELQKGIILFDNNQNLQDDKVLSKKILDIQKQVVSKINNKVDLTIYTEAKAHIYLGVLKNNNQEDTLSNDTEEYSWLYSIASPILNIIRFRNITMKKLLESTIELHVKCMGEQKHETIKLVNKPNPWIWPLQVEDGVTRLQDLMIKNKEDEEVSCNYCNATLAIKVKLIEPPDILTIQLSRFANGAKNNQLFDIPEKLYSDENDVSWEGNFHYKLYAVVVQRGEMQSGHYWAYARDSNDSWYCYNDQPGEKTSIKTDGADYTLEQDGTTYGVFKNKEVEQMTEEEIEKILKPQYKTQEESSKNGVNADIWPTPYMLFYVKTQGSEDEELIKKLEKEEKETPRESEAKYPQPIFNQGESLQQALDDKVQKKPEEGKEIVPQSEPQPINQSEQKINQQATPPITATQKAEKQQTKDSTSPEEPGFFASIASSAANAIQWVAQTLWSIVSLPFRWLFGN